MLCPEDIQKKVQLDNMQHNYGILTQISSDASVFLNAIYSAHVKTQQHNKNIFYFLVILPSNCRL